MAPFQLSGQEVYISASIGIAQAGAAYVHPEDLIRDADLAMYQAKKWAKPDTKSVTPNSTLRHANASSWKRPCEMHWNAMSLNCITSRL